MRSLSKDSKGSGGRKRTGRARRGGTRSRAPRTTRGARERADSADCCSRAELPRPAVIIRSVASSKLHMVEQNLRSCAKSKVPKGRESVEVRGVKCSFGWSMVKRGQTNLACSRQGRSRAWWMGDSTRLGFEAINQLEACLPAHTTATLYRG